MVQDQALEIRELLQLICSIRQLKTIGHHLKMTGLIVVRLITCRLKMTSIFVGILMTYVCISLQTKYVVLRWQITLICHQMTDTCCLKITAQQARFCRLYPKHVVNMWSAYFQFNSLILHFPLHEHVLLQAQLLQMQPQIAALSTLAVKGGSQAWTWCTKNFLVFLR